MGLGNNVQECGPASATSPASGEWMIRKMRRALPVSWSRQELKVKVLVHARRASAQAHMSACDVKVLADRVKGALFGLLIGDALSMPTHWFYGGERQVLHWPPHLADSRDR